MCVFVCEHASHNYVYMLMYQAFVRVCACECVCNSSYARVTVCINFTGGIDKYTNLASQLIPEIGGAKALVFVDFIATNNQS